MDGSKQLFPGQVAHPGDTLTFYGTGAGPVTGDEAMQQTPRNLSNIPLEFVMGGVSATVTYHGRSQYPGLDQFNVVVPPGAIGCTVSVTAQSGNYLSNSVFLAVAASGQTCSDAAAGNSSVSISFTSTGNNVVLGSLSLAERNTQTSSAGLVGVVIEAGTAYFQSFPLPPGVGITSSSNNPVPSLGGCLVNDYSLPPTPPPPTGFVSSQPPYLNAGPAINFTGPNGLNFISASGQPGYYNGALSLITGQMFIPPGGGSFTIDNGSGGPDIGAFKEQINFPPLLAFSNAGSIGTAIDRSQPLTVQWSGGDPNGYVSIGGGSSVNGLFETGANFECTAPASAGQFTIPASILMALPAQAVEPGALEGPSLRISSTQGASFTAPGAAGGIVNLLSAATLQVGYR